MKPGYKVRYYQEEGVLSLYNYWMEQHGNPVIALPTGTGKSVVIAEFLRSVFTYFKGQRVIMLTHVKELIKQNYDELIELWPMAPAGIYSAGLRRREVRPIVFAGIASVVGKSAELGAFDLIGVDECHLVSPHDDTNYRNFINEQREMNPAVKVWGLSATPYRMGQGLLTDPVPNKKGDKFLEPLFTDICYDLTGLKAFNKLITEGYICPLVPRRTGKELDVSRVKITAGEFNQAELQRAVDRNEITAQCIDEMIDSAFNDAIPRHCWLIFATGVDHSEHVAEALRERGISAQAIHSKMESEKRDLYIKQFKQGEITCLVNNNILTTGFNCPQVDLIGVLRPTNSTVLWVQLLGRGTRPFPGKTNCLVLDFAGNTRRLGPINDPVLPRKKGRKGSGSAPVKCCEKCGTYNHASVRFCEFCGEEFPITVKIEGKASEMELIRGVEPQIEIFPVRSVNYHKYQRGTKTPSLKVVYFYGLYQEFTEWICLEHPKGTFPSVKARKWWRARSQYDPPETIDDAMMAVDELDTPTHIRVCVNSKHPEILAYDFTGTAFGTEQKGGLPQKETQLELEDVPF